MRPITSSSLSRRQLFFLLSLVLVLLVASRSWRAPFTWAESSSSGSGKIFGVKSRSCFNVGDCESAFPSGFVSAPQAHLFSFESDGTNFIDLGPITLNEVEEVEIDVDGLAQSPTYGLLGFQLDHDATGAVSRSTLLSIDPVTAVASPIGTALPREIRGATFDATDQLWVIDALGAEVLQIDPATGAEVPGTAVSPTFFGTPGIVSDSSDLAQHPDGTFYITSASDIYTLDILTGDLTLVTAQPDQSLAGMAFTPGAEEHLFTYDIFFEDDLFRFDLNMSGIPRTTLLADIIDTFAAGRGDLAAPLPTCTPPPPGMIAWFPLDTDPGSLVGNIDPADVAGSDVTFGVPGKVGGAAQFNGSTSVFIAQNASGSLGLTAFSLDAWIRLEGDDANSLLVHLLGVDNPLDGVLFGIDETNRLGLSIQDDSGESQIAVLSQSTLSSSDGWIHVAATWQRNTLSVEDLRLYVNGVDDTDESTYQAVGDGVAQLQIDSLIWIIGADIFSTVIFNGLIDELELFDRALSPAEVQALYAAGSAGKCREFCTPPPANMISWWPLESDAQDIIGPNEGTSTDVTFVSNGKVDSAGLFNGSSSVITIENASGASGLTELSVDAWIRINGGENTRRFIFVQEDVDTSEENPFEVPLEVPFKAPLQSHGSPSGNFGSHLEIDETNRLRLSIQDGSGDSWIGIHSVSTLSPTDGLVHVAGTWRRNNLDASDIRLYINGVDDTDESSFFTSGPNLASLQIDSTKWAIGHDIRGFGTYFNGLIDELEVFDRALSPAEIQAIYEADSAGKCKDGIDDLDQDGFTVEQGDCDDTNATVFPGGTEICDGLDNNCDGFPDSTFDGGDFFLSITQTCYTGPEGTAGVAACQEGTQTCTDGTFGECIGEITPVPEMCDAADNDCDGSVDEDFSLGAPCAVGVGACVNTGVFICSSDETTSQCNAFPGEPQLEVCNNVDDDCDGQVDILVFEGGSSPIQQTCYSGLEGTSGVGECVSGIQTCTAGEFGLCEGEVVPAPEVCDGLDNDCDGTIDLPALSSSELKRIANDAGAQDRFGITVAVDGNYAVVGAPMDDDLGNNAGAAYVYTRSGQTWFQQTKLLASDGAASDTFGQSVSIFGTTILVGTSKTTAYVFVYGDENWEEQAKLTPADEVTFGADASVALFEDTALLGAPSDDEQATNAGAAYIFTRSGTAWSEQAKLLASDGGAQDQLGSSVALFEDTALLGAPSDDDQGTNAGAAYVFTRVGTTWSEQAKLLASDGGAQDQFGNSVALDGDYGLIGAHQDDDQGSNAGAAYVFLREADTWSEQTKLLASDGTAADFFGTSVALYGQRAVVGAPREGTQGNNAGAAYVFVRTGPNWSEQTKLLASDGSANAWFGDSVAVSEDTILVGASSEDSAAVNAGAVYFYNLGLTPLELCDGADNDCDGLVDQGFDIGGTCVVGVGACEATGVYECSSDGFDSTCTAVPGTPTPEVCDGLDNDCDGQVDEDFNVGIECTAGSGACEAGGVLVCSPDGQGTICNAEEALAVPELCDGLDNDCDDEIDEDFSLGGACVVGVGACVNTGVFVCAPDGSTSQCSAFPGEPQPEVCNNIDDDCDGQVDMLFEEGTFLPLQQVCYSGPDDTAGVGVCQAGMQTCIDGTFGLCEGEILPSEDLCGDGLDNDCDGTIDIPSLASSELKRMASDVEAQDRFGFDVAVDGDYAVVGMPADDDLGSDAGAAYVYARSGQTWVQQTKLMASDGSAKAAFGQSVAIFGTTILVGSNGPIAYVFVYDEKGWEEQAQLVPSDGVTFGANGSVALFEDTALLGALLDDEQDTDAGAAYVFTRAGTTWTEQAKLLARDGEVQDRFGSKVAVSGDTALIGAPLNDEQGTNAGAAYVFTRSGTTWSEQAKLLARDGAAQDQFGTDVSLDGERALIGSPRDDDLGDQSGSAYVFLRDGTLWLEEIKLLASEGSGANYFGERVALYGQRALIGANRHPANGNNAGAAYVFVRTGPIWTEQSRLLASDGSANAWFGDSVALSATTAVVGASSDDTDEVNAGSVYFYDLAQAPVEICDGADNDCDGLIDQGYGLDDVCFAGVGQCAAEGAYECSPDGLDPLCTATPGLPTPEVCDELDNDCDGYADFPAIEFPRLALEAQAQQWFGNAIDIDGDVAIIGAPLDPGGTHQGAAHIMVRHGSTWLRQAKLVLNDPSVPFPNLFGFGAQVALDGNTALVGNWTLNSPVFVFVRDGNDWVEQAQLTIEADGNFSLRAAALEDDTALVVGSTPFDPAVYVFVRDGDTWTQQAELVASDFEDHDFFGTSVALSGDVVLVGAPNEDDLGEDAGAAYVFVRDGETWRQEVKLLASDGGVENRFGASVALDDDVALIGAPGTFVFGTNAREVPGAAYIFERDGGTWTEQAKLLGATVEDDDLFGNAVALEGDTALIGVSRDDEFGNNSGAMYQFQRVGAEWIEQRKFTASNASANASFGLKLALSGSTALVAAPREDTQANNAGAVYFYELGRTPIDLCDGLDEDCSNTVDQGFGIGETCFVGIGECRNSGVYECAASGGGRSCTAVPGLPTEEVCDGLDNDCDGYADFPVIEFPRLAMEEQAQQWFGNAIDIDGDVAIIGAPLDAEGTHQGAAHIMVRNGPTWMRQAKLVIDDPSAPFFHNLGVGAQVALDGDTALVGNWTLNAPVFVFVRDGNDWVEQAQLTIGAQGNFGLRALALEGDTALVVGTVPFDPVVYVFVRDGETWTQQAELVASDFEDHDFFGTSVALSGDVVLVGARGEDELGEDAGAAYVFVRDGETWSQEAKLLASDGGVENHFGWSVALDGEVALIGAPGTVVVGTNARTLIGAAYIFERNGGTWTEQAKLLGATVEDDDRFGDTVALEGDTALIGAPRDDERADRAGALYQFQRVGAEWIEQRKFTASNASASAFFGLSLALSGSTALVGAPREDTQANNAGAVYFYELLESPADVCDGVDNNCDGIIDQGFDLGGVCMVGIGECRTAGVYVCTSDGLGRECTAQPGLPTPEVCDGLDNDCDGGRDEGLSFDLDGDEHSTPSSCSGTKDDCDDTNPDIHPGTKEICEDGIDQDCDGQDAPCPNTDVGKTVESQPVDTTTGTMPATLTFEKVKTPGITSLTTSSSGPPPESGFALGDPPVYFELTTTAEFAGSITVCIDYSGFKFRKGTSIRLYHFEKGKWQDRTVSLDTTNKIVCAEVDSLSPFVIFETIPAAEVCDPIPAGAIIGTEGNDVLRGTPGDDVIIGLGGDDEIDGIDGNDVICAGDGNDTVLGGAGHDSIDGGDGNDELNGQGGNDLLTGGPGADILFGKTGMDVISGDEGNDTINGGSGNDILEGGADNDVLRGERGDDSLDGGAGDDDLNGGSGDDLLDGGDDIDILDGQSNTDTCLNGEQVAHCELP